MLKAAALAFRTSAQKEGTHAGGQTHTDRVHIRFDVLHGVKNPQPVVDRSTRRIDVEVDVLVRILSFQKKHLGNNSVGGITGYSFPKKNDALAQQS